MFVKDPPRPVAQQQVAVIRPEDNEILGSGNFDVIKGGTFYAQDEVRYHRLVIVGSNTVFI